LTVELGFPDSLTAQFRICKCDKHRIKASKIDFIVVLCDIDAMPKTSPVYPFEVASSLKGLGEMLSVARRARQDTLLDAAQRCGVHSQTISRIEQGDPGVAVGTIFLVMSTYGMAQRLFELSEIDEETEILMRKHIPQRPRNEA
jgi:hypothetical protein